MSTSIKQLNVSNSDDTKRKIECGIPKHLNYTAVIEQNHKPGTYHK